MKTKKKNNKATILTYRLPDGRVCVWTRKDILRNCPMCRVPAVVELPPELKAIQPDNTILVCHPGFGGCNQGFEFDL